MISIEFYFFRRHTKPIKHIFLTEKPTFPELKAAYYQIHRFPKLTGYGISVPAILLTIFFFEIELLHIPYEYILYGLVCATLIAGMHAMIEYYHTSSVIFPLLDHVQLEALQRYNQELTLEGEKVVSLKTKFQLSALLFGAFPLLLFSLATQMRLSQREALLIEIYWIWSMLVLLVGCGLSLYGARLLFSIVQQPLNQLHSKMKQV
ncbi:hypothetical protein [Bacillus sp. LL01]|uniref:hypothetical protein n=1 Tax=Bacillus sp. LL01 TaxID=1665556 RepID=UPI000AB120DA|nr:hypothetical protein [Bacillus sp. LL01]